MRLAILGGTGWLGKALAQRVLEGGLAAPQDLAIMNRRGPTSDFDAWPGLRWADDAATLADNADVLVLSVRPEDFPVAGIRSEGALVLSFMARVPLARLEVVFGHRRIVRAMPNGGASSGTSFTPWLAGDGATAADRDCVRRLLAAIGSEAEIASEAELDYLSALSGSGTAYPALMAEAMLEDARARGLSEPVARAAVEAVICGSAPLLAGRIETVPEVLGVYRSYRGPTEAGLDAAEAAGFKTAIRAALAAASRKAMINGD